MSPLHRRIIAIIPLIISACGIAERAEPVPAGTSGEWPVSPHTPAGTVSVPRPATGLVHTLDLMNDGQVSLITHRINAVPTDQQVRLIGGELILRSEPNAGLHVTALDIVLDDVVVPTGTPGE